MTTLQRSSHPQAGKAAFSIPSILAIIAAFASFTVAPGWQLLLCLAAVVLGIIGIVISLLPGVRGGLISFLSIAAGGIGALVAIIRLLASL